VGHRPTSNQASTAAHPERTDPSGGTAAQKAITEQNRAWWSAFAVSGLPMPSRWSDDERVSITIDGGGTAVRSVTLSSPEVTMHLVVRGDDLLIAQVTVPS